MRDRPVGLDLDLMRDEAVDETVADMRHAMIEDMVAKHIPENA